MSTLLTLKQQNSSNRRRTHNVRIASYKANAKDKAFAEEGNTSRQFVDRDAYEYILDMHGAKMAHEPE